MHLSEIYPGYLRMAADNKIEASHIEIGVGNIFRSQVFL